MMSQMMNSSNHDNVGNDEKKGNNVCCSSSCRLTFRSTIITSNFACKRSKRVKNFRHQLITLVNHWSIIISLIHLYHEHDRRLIRMLVDTNIEPLNLINFHYETKFYFLFNQKDWTNKLQSFLKINVKDLKD